MKIIELFTKEEESAIVAAIVAAEKHTSGEIRVHIEASRKGKETIDRAVEVFQELEMHQTQARNGVLFYLAYEDHAFSIFGDQGINEKVPPGFWDSTRDLMQEAFRRSAFAEGLIAGIGEAGRALKDYFPYESNDKNELDDSISKG
ncbi:TPM domain-containing protein [Flavobacteriaceae bacterium LSUCC0859]|nr:TPM domain-containing protein [Flavobacteriaceae bacterium LSUCC0859]